MGTSGAPPQPAPSPDVRILVPHCPEKPEIPTRTLPTQTSPLFISSYEHKTTQKEGEVRQAIPGTTWLCHQDIPTGPHRPHAPWFWLTPGSPAVRDLDPTPISAAVSVQHLPYLEMDQNQGDTARDPVSSCTEPGKPLQSGPARNHAQGYTDMAVRAYVHTSGSTLGLQAPPIQFLDHGLV